VTVGVKNYGKWYNCPIFKKIDGRLAESSLTQTAYNTITCFQSDSGSHLGTSAIYQYNFFPCKA
jgi:hypothetical protein